jgi:hypothetical protein
LDPSKALLSKLILGVVHKLSQVFLLLHFFKAKDKDTSILLRHYLDACLLRYCYTNGLSPRWSNFKDGCFKKCGNYL